MLDGASTIILERFNGVLSNFIKAFEGKLNSEKLKVYGWNFPPSTMVRIGRILGFEGNVAWNSFNYLGIPIFKGNKRVVD